MAKQQTPTPATKPPIIALDTVAGLEREAVTIDGERYTLRHAAELSLTNLRRLERFGADFTALCDDDGELPDTENDAAAKLLEASVPIVLDAPTDVLGRLTPAQRFAVMNVFTELQPSTRRPAAGANGANPSRTGSRSPRGSRGSMGKRRSTGSPSAQGKSSKR